MASRPNSNVTPILLAISSRTGAPLSRELPEAAVKKQVAKPSSVLDVYGDVYAECALQPFAVGGFAEYLSAAHHLGNHAIHDVAGDEANQEEDDDGDEEECQDYQKQSSDDVALQVRPRLGGSGRERPLGGIIPPANQ